MSRHVAILQPAIAALSGLLFGAGLFISGMTNPLKIIGFLDFGGIPHGHWDPSLALVIVPAILVMFAAVRLGRRRKSPLAAARFHEPALRRIDAPLIVGSALFGLGWGMSGICPGPAVALLAFRPSGLWLFLAALVVGLWLGGLFKARRGEAAAAPVAAE